MKRFTTIVVSVVLTLFSLSFSAEKKLLVIASGETHAMLVACDCPTEPGGGFAKRATIVSRYRDTNDVILVDAGGFSGGDMYDPYTEGRAVDSLRTLAALRAMGYLKYDAVCIGDDDLQYGTEWIARQAFYAKVPLVSANCFYANGKLVGAPYIIVKKGKHSIAITGVTTQETLLHKDSSVIIKPPVQSLKAIWGSLKASSDIRIILAHIGEAGSRELLDSFPDCALVMNGHRKTTMEEFVTENGQAMLQFGFQGKSLSFAEIVPDSKGFSPGRTGWISVGPAVAEDPEVSRLVTLPGTAAASAAQPVFDLYIMSLCQYGCAALSELTDFLGSFPSVQWSVWFIGSTFIDSSATSLHGQAEVDDEKLWLAVQSLYPDRWFQFLRNRSAHDRPRTDAIIRDMGLDFSKISAWAAKKGAAELRRHYQRSMRMGINASPTLLINNTVFQENITRFRLSKFTCGHALKPPSSCDSLPECETSEDCTSPGKTGTCVSHGDKRAKCEFKDAPRFTLTVVTPDSALFHTEYEVFSRLKTDFPGMVIDTVKTGSPRGSAIVKEYSPVFLPWFLFDTTIRAMANYPSVAEGLVSYKSKLVFRDGMFKPSYFYKRKLMPGTIELHVDPVFPGSIDALRIAMPQGGKAVRIMPALFASPDSSGLSAEDKMRNEEALRWLVLQKYYPAKFAGYLSLFCSRKDMSYWFTDCKSIGINIDEFVETVRKNAALLSAYWKETGPLGMKEPVELLIANREVVSVKNPRQLAEILQKVTR
jgi:hypothetical protein